MTELENPYKTLGVERTADERAIKKAYVALVRKFSPESHPEEFKKIRAAYELLSDAGARARFDDSEKGYDEYGEEVSHRLAEVDAAMADGKPELAREILADAAKRFPDVTVIQEKLGFHYLVAKEPEKALAVFDALVTKEPENGRHHLHCAFALDRLERHPQTERALRSACRLDPKDVRFALALADFFIARGRTAEAVGVADEMLLRISESLAQAISLLMRKVEAYARAGIDAALMSAIDDLKTRVDGASDRELGPFVSTQLAAIAAGLFASKRPSAANRILGRCGEFSESQVERPFPSMKVAALAGLPEAFRSWLEEISKSPDTRFTLRERTWLLPGFVLYATAALFVFVLWSFAEPRASLDGGAWAGAFALIGAAAVGFAFALAWALRILTSPLRSFTTLHPLYIVQAKPDRVTFYPLFALTNVNGTHHHTNGIYTGTSLTLTFGDDAGVCNLQISIRGKELAQEWLGTMAAVRGRSLELLAEGCLEAEHLVEELPPGALAPLPAPTRARGLAKPIVAGLVAAAVAVPLTGFAALRGGEDRAIAEATAKGTPDAWQAYIDEHPKGRHLELARAAKQRADERAAKRAKMVLAGTTHPAANGAAAIMAAIAYAREHRTKVALDLVVDGDAFGARPAATKALGEHFARVVGAAGSEDYVAAFGEAHSDGAPRIVIRLSDGATKTLHPDIEASFSIARDAGPVPKVADVITRGAVVELTVETPSAAPFRARIEVDPPTTLYSVHRRSKTEATPEAEAIVLTTERAFDAATSALGFLGPVARLELSETNSVVTGAR